MNRVTHSAAIKAVEHAIEANTLLARYIDQQVERDLAFHDLLAAIDAGVTTDRGDLDMPNWRAIQAARARLK